ncbi:MAG: tRNA (adenosine(37)-N6)-threonylcarbamoyltransferase complex ATPase subunit type 1 TsaE [Oscillospiraceae bacterium]|nr:tRNA (adenosine(37)-N6)-threonylcarbamoyltransferase complex ATPase subunit type 1 TsaE [Oscillospiraceae bacterium]
MLSHSPNETKKIAAELALVLPPETQVVALDGDLGAGKTAFAQGFIAALGVNGAIASPTYAIVNEYGKIFHFDWYRLSSEDELYDIGWHEYLERGLCVVEWSERIPQALPEHTVRVKINVVDENTRELHFVPNILSPASPNPGTT